MPNIRAQWKRMGALIIALTAGGVLSSAAWASLAGDVDALEDSATGRFLIGIGATTFGGLSGNFIGSERPAKASPARSLLPMVQNRVIRFEGTGLLSDPSLSWPFAHGTRTHTDIYDIPRSFEAPSSGVYVDPYIRVEDVPHSLPPIAPRP